MTRKMAVSASLPADVEAAFGILTSDAFVARRAVELGDGARVVHREADSTGGLLLAVSRELPGGAPSMVQRFLPADGRVVQTDHWSAPDDDGVRRGSWRVESAGVPAHLEGTMRLEPAAGGCLHVVEGTVTVTVPLIGGKAESMLVEMTEKLAAREAELLRQLLADS